MYLRIIFVVLITLLGYFLGKGKKELITYILTSAGLSGLVATIEYLIQKKNGKNVFFGFIGMIMGLTLATGFYFIFKAFTKNYFSNEFSAVFLGIFAYLGYAVGYTKGSDIKLGIGAKANPDAAFANYKILDTSVIIDGRIADIAESGFIEGIMVVPKFVLKELQQVADSSDSLKRSRGRRGLDILNKMKASKKAIIKITDKDFLEIKEVDHKLLKLASYLDGVVITNDYNLNKVAEFEGIQILNINDLANAVKPNVLPNEELRIQIIKEGKDQNQGIGYLDDGTMVVVDNGKFRIGEEVEVEVTSILQTPAGRMIFTQLSEKEEKHSSRNRKSRSYSKERSAS
jgi:uncharacterized protein YacL